MIGFKKCVSCPKRFSETGCEVRDIMSYVDRIHKRTLVAYEGDNEAFRYMANIYPMVPKYATNHNSGALIFDTESSCEFMVSGRDGKLYPPHIRAFIIEACLKIFMDRIGITDESEAKKIHDRCMEIADISKLYWGNQL